MQLILDVNDNSKAALLLEFLKGLNYVSSVKQVVEDNDFVVPEWHKEIVLDRVKNAKPEDYIEWKDFKKELKRKYDF
jgi:hypothetical protein